MKRLPGKRGEKTYNPQEVLYLTGNINYCYLHLLNGQVILSCRTLKWFSDQWPHFLRVHKKVLINQAYIVDYKPSGKATETNYVIMANNIQLEIARRRAPAILAILEQLYLANRPSG